MTTRVATFPLRLPVSLKTALETISGRDGTRVNQFLVVAAAEKIAAMQTEEFFLERQKRADRQAFRRFLNRIGGEAPRSEDEWNADKEVGSAKVKTAERPKPVQRARQLLEQVVGPAADHGEGFCGRSPRTGALLSGSAKR